MTLTQEEIVAVKGLMKNCSDPEQDEGTKFDEFTDYMNRLAEKYGCPMCPECHTEFALCRHGRDRVGDTGHAHPAPGEGAESAVSLRTGRGHHPLGACGGAPKGGGHEAC